MAKKTYLRRRSKLRLVLPLIKQRLADKAVFTLAQMRLGWGGNPDAVPPAMGTHDVILSPGAERREGAFDEGSARSSCRVRRQLLVTIRTKWEVDEYGDQTQLLTEAPDGHHEAEDLVVDALYDFFPADPDTGDELTYEGLGFAGVSEPRPSQQRGWAVSTVTMEIPLVRDLTGAASNNQSTW